jgi:cytochrome c-type biogenesis protein CcmF
VTAEFGTFFLIIALLAALLQSAYFWPQAKAPVAVCLRPAAWLQSLAITLAFATLMVLRLNSDFSVVNVAQHSNLTLPLLYKIAGTWGNHEGSMLLFAWVLVFFGLLLAISREENRLAVAVQSLIGAGMLLFILFTSNPFERQFPPALDGEALNPILQDIALAMHPPLLYLGYVGFSIVYSLAVAALIRGKMDRGWAQSAHPWILAAWSALTLGIGLGSWWAYRELGWGGWWFWDPVENASLLPWLSGTALLHSNIVLKKRGLLAPWVALLAIITFGLSLLGTFLVRSGVLTSVHGFASDPERGLFILGYMVLVIGGALLLFALRAGRFSSKEQMLPLSREGMIVINNLFLLTACATVLLGTVYPLLAEWFTDNRITVGPPYFNATFIPLMIIPLLFTGLALLMPWKRASFIDALTRAAPSLLAALAAAFLALSLAKSEIAFAAIGFTLAAWLAASSLQYLRTRAAGAASVFLGHLGVAVMVAGITGVGLWKQESERMVANGDIVTIAGYRLAYEAQPFARAANYAVSRGKFTVSNEAGRTLSVLTPEYRMYDIKQTATSEAAIYSIPLSDLYAVIGESSPDGSKVAARFYYVPMIHFIWLGFVLMALGGALAIVQQWKVRFDKPAF